MPHSFTEGRGSRLLGGMRRLLLLPLLATTLAAGPKPDAEAKLKEKVAEVWLDYAKWCRDKAARAEGERAIGFAREANPAAKDLESLAEAIGALEEAGNADPGLPARKDKANKDAAALYQKLAGLDHDAKEDARFLGYLLRAAELTPTKPLLGKLQGMLRQNAGNAGKADATGGILVKLRALDPEGAAKGTYDALEADLAQKDVALIQGDHPMVGWLSLPKGWNRKAEYAVLVTVDGAGSNFLGAARGFAGGRGSRNVIVLAPCSLSNTNELQPEKYPFYGKPLLDENNARRIEFDLAGLDALLKVVRERYRGEEKIGITGFSGGGNLCYGWTARNPQRTRFAAPACANFGGQGFQEAAAVEGGGPPIHIFTGEKDEHRFLTFGKTPPGIEQQTDMALEALKKLGFANLTRTMVPGMGHSSAGKQVWEFFDEVTKKA